MMIIMMMMMMMMMMVVVMMMMMMMMMVMITEPLKGFPLLCCDPGSFHVLFDERLVSQIPAYCPSLSWELPHAKICHMRPFLYKNFFCLILNFLQLSQNETKMFL